MCQLWALHVVIKRQFFLHLFTVMAEFTAHVKSSSNITFPRLAIDAFGSVKMGFGGWEQKCFYTVSLRPPCVADTDIFILWFLL